MRRTRILALLILFLISTMILGPATTYAQTPSLAIIESYTVKNIDGSDMTNGTLMAGATYVISLDVNVSVDLANTTLTLSTPLEKVQAAYWSLENDYPGVDTETFQPGQSSIDFDIVKGIAQFKLTGAIPSDYTSEQLPNGDYLHFIKEASLVKLYLGTETLDDVTIQVKDQAIDTYQQILTEKNNLLQTTTTEAKYASFAHSVIDQAENLSNQGYVQNAINLLNTIPSTSSGLPTPISESSSLPYIIIIVVLAIIAIALIALFLRARASVSFIRHQVDEEAGRLDVLSVKATKIDKQLARDIEHVKEQIDRISGR
ncbi:MAG: hypothetical protein SVO26_00055 [Chloroflexota bacterium]|nr:hypothetical protein [Chloroflexota bacterium]